AQGHRLFLWAVHGSVPGPGRPKCNIRNQGCGPAQDALDAPLPQRSAAPIEPILMNITPHPKSGTPTRHVVSINNLSNGEVETIFAVAQSFLDELPDKSRSYRIGRSTDIASHAILASLFYEPSTRTRLSFESAMLRLGGDIITSA